MLRIFLLICCIWQFASGNAVPTTSDFSSCTHSNNVTSPKIVIIGAGPSGIACATKLLEYGFENVQILEAEPRIGGRIYTIPFGENVVDLGAQWCHGEKDNVVYELASKLNLLETSGSDNYQCIRSNREVLPEKIDIRLKGLVYDRSEDFFAILRNYNGSFGSYLSNMFYETIKKPEYSDIDQTIAKEFFENFEKMECTMDAADSLDDVSARSLAAYSDCEGDQTLNWKGKGYKEFLRLLLKTHELGTELGVLEKHIVLSKTVTQINWNTDKSNVEIACKDGEVIEADHVVVTVSLGVLKEQHENLFKPKLPAAKIHAIDGISFGTVNKIFLEFSEPFWPANWTGFSFLWRDKDLTEIRGTSLAWLESLFGFYTVSYQPKLLEGWIIGPSGRFMETLPTDEVLAGCMFLLRKFLTWEIPDPVNIKPTAWSTNVNFRGSYSFRSLHTQEVGARAFELAEPLTAKGDRCNKPIVQFAGEATHEDHYSSVHGATETGWREARVLAELYGKLKTAGEEKTRK